MNSYAYELRKIRARAGVLAGRGRRFGLRLDPDELTQNTFLRFFEKGLDRRVDPRKGSALSVLNAVLTFVFLEVIRLGQRDRRIVDLDGDVLPAHTAVPLQDVLTNELLSILCEGFGLLTERERVAVLRVYGPLFGCCGTGRPTPSDYVAAHRALEKLRAYARERGLIEE